MVRRSVVADVWVGGGWRQGGDLCVRCVMRRIDGFLTFPQMIVSVVALRPLRPTREANTERARPAARASRVDEHTRKTQSKYGQLTHTRLDTHHSFTEEVLQCLDSFFVGHIENIYHWRLHGRSRSSSPRRWYSRRCSGLHLTALARRVRLGHLGCEHQPGGGWPLHPIKCFARLSGVCCACVLPTKGIQCSGSQPVVPLANGITT